MYLVFAGSTYYPSGGWADYKGKFDTEKEALMWIARNANDKMLDWWHIVALPKYEIITESK